MNVLIVDGGGRGHALAWKVAQSPLFEKAIIAPGNVGCRDFAQLSDVPAEDIVGLANLAEKERIDLTIVGPEAPLAAGIVDEFSKRGLPIFGPSSQAAKIESSKWWAKKFMRRHGIPTADAKIFASADEAVEYTQELDEGSYVIKLSRLAAGKGVMIPHAWDEARAALLDKNGTFYPKENSPVIIEDRMLGQEVSVFAFLDGETVSNEVAACDYKRVGEGDVGPNTGGVGSFTPPHFWSGELSESIRQKILIPTAKGMVAEGVPYSGVLYAGLMITEEGPKVVEFNCRFGDPECQTILPSLNSNSDFLKVCRAVSEGRLSEIVVEWDSSPRVTVVLFSEGYPERYEKGKEITGLDKVANTALVFHAGTALDSDGRLVTAGGRVLGITCEGNSIEVAIENAYSAADCINFDGMRMRRDIGAKALLRYGMRMRRDIGAKALLR